MGFHVARMTRDDPRFYPIVGPFLGRREIARELGGPVGDDDGKTWFAAVADGRAQGLCAALPRGGVTAYQSDYVLPEFRRRGVYAALRAARAEAFPGRARAVCTTAALPYLLADGFRPVRARGRFTIVERG